MATNKSDRHPPMKEEAPTGFDITCVIGSVEFDEMGEESPQEAAFKLIARHDAPGTYWFPLGGDAMCRVEVGYREVGTNRVLSPHDIPN